MGHLLNYQTAYDSPPCFFPADDSHRSRFRKAVSIRAQWLSVRLAKHFISHPYFDLLYIPPIKIVKLGMVDPIALLTLYYLFIGDGSHVSGESAPCMWRRTTTPDGMTGTRFREHCNVDLGRCHSDYKYGGEIIGCGALMWVLPNILTYCI